MVNHLKVKSSLNRSSNNDGYLMIKSLRKGAFHTINVSCSVSFSNHRPYLKRNIVSINRPTPPHPTPPSIGISCMHVAIVSGIFPSTDYDVGLSDVSSGLI